MNEDNDNRIYGSNPDINSGSSSEHGGDARLSGEYHFYRPEESRSTWSDAGYVPSADAGAMPKSYHCSAAPEKKEKKPRKGLRAALVAFALVGALALGGAGGAFAYRALEKSGASGPAESTVLNVAAPAVTANRASVTTQLVQGNGPLTAEEIYYNLAVNQTVAITTEITYTNVWGFTTTGAVKGSGFIISADGYILTNFHVIEDAVKGGYDIQVLLYDGTEYTATVVGYASDNDVAVLKIEATGLNAVTIGDSDSLRVGQQVYAVGNPLGELEFTMTDGMVSATDREISTSDNRATTISMFQISAAINSGNSGGPVYNDRGEVIGIATAKYASSGVEGLGFAIPINDAVALAQDLITDGYVRGRAYMGINADTVTASAAQYYGLVEGAIVTKVSEGSAAEKAGLKESDIIVAMGDKEIKSYEDLVSAKKAYHAGDTVELKVYRSSDYVTLSLTFDEQQPEEPETEEQTDNGDNNGNNGNNNNNRYNGGQTVPGYGYGYGDNWDFFDNFFNFGW